MKIWEMYHLKKKNPNSRFHTTEILIFKISWMLSLSQKLRRIGDPSAFGLNNYVQYYTRAPYSFYVIQLKCAKFVTESKTHIKL